ncbi:hypothetical protein [Streptomyces sp. NPDC006012]|uniref:hypothetical protein n=1 Tax=Streptomyces sp. NPDC006012 TaxID=3364739 RepID=UPI0036C2CC29
MSSTSNSPASSVAWEEAATKDAWTKLFTFAVLGQVLWPVMSLGAFVLMILLGKWSMWFLLPLSLYALYRAFIQRQYIVSAVQMRRILKVYPWRSQETPESGIGQIPGAKLGDVWLAFPNPDRPDTLVRVILHGHVRSVWWRRRLGRGYETEKTAQVATVWFAGDPRFAGVVAVPGPRRLFVLYQLAAATTGGERGFSPEALSRAQLAGVKRSVVGQRSTG